MLTRTTCNQEVSASEFPGYTILAPLAETPHAVVYRARRIDSKDTVVIKSLKAKHPTAFEIARFKYEFGLIKDNPVPGIVRVLDIIKQEQSIALVLEDFHGASLDTFERRSFSLESLLDLFVRLAQTLGALHEKNMVHRDIKPPNILYNRQEDIIKIGDFGIASEFTGINEEIYSPRVIEGTLAYMSPEQTGRMNCTLDYRTDLYSLGVTMYEMLTGAVPFMADDPMELIHAHIARVPNPPHEVNPDIPVTVSDVVMKLLAKAPSERYQNSFGLMEDLRECLQRLRDRGRIERFMLGTRDVSPLFSIPQILVGRDREIRLLEASLERISSGAVAVLLVTGEPGVGKSALVNEMNRLIVNKKGHFIAGKYNQFQRQVPYSAIVQAFQALAPQLLSESEQRLNTWKESLLEAVGINGKIITDAIPEMELIIGRQPDLPEVGPEETENRFSLVFKNFVKAFCRSDHPLVIFLDDLQWADAASLKLIQSIVTDAALSHLLVIGAYRDNEMAAHHPLMLTLEAVKSRGTWLEKIELSSLSEENVRHIVANLLRSDLLFAEPLSTVTHAKTMGNPFFVGQFLNTLYEKEHLTLDPQKGWAFDPDAIRQVQVTDNVVDLMTEKIVRLKEVPLQAIRIAACIGNTFDIETVASVMGLTLAEAFRIMDELVETGLIQQGKGLYRFQHDRIQEAAYALLSPADRESVHYQVGQEWLRKTPAEEMGSRCFAICDQFNQAGRRIASVENKYRIAALNLTAGRKAKEATAYEASAAYLKNGMDLLPENAWSDNYELTYALYKDRMEAEHLNRHFDASERLFAEINRHARDRKDRARAYHTMIVLFTTVGKIQEALDLGIEGVKMFGIRLSKESGKLPVVLEIIRFKRRLKQIGIDNIPHLPVCTDQDTLAKCELYGGIGLPAYYANPNLLALTVLKGINGDLQHGLVHTSAFGFIAIAAILSSELGDFTTAYQLGEMALRLNEKMSDKRHAAKVQFVFGFMIVHWTRPLQECLAYFARAYQIGLETGDFIYCGNSLNAAFGLRLMTGENIDVVIQEHARYRDFQAKIKDPFVTAQYDQCAQYGRMLKGETERPGSLNSEEREYDRRIDALREQGNLLGVFIDLFRKEQAGYLFGNYEEAYRIGFEMDTLLEYPKGSYYLVEHLFHRCLCLLAVYKKNPPAEQRRIRKIYAAHKKKIKKWLDLSPVNLAPKYALMRAEEAVVANKHLEAADLYREAIKGAREKGFTIIEALANERAAMFYLAKSHDEIARVYLQAAYDAYEKWGATGKTKLMAEIHPLLKAPAPTAKASPVASSNSSGSIGLNATLLDLTTVMKVSQTISSEIMIDKLLAKIMHEAVMNAGAQKGFFILATHGRLTIEAALTAGSDETATMQTVPLDHSRDLSAAIVHYVHRSRERVILGNAAAEGEFKNDPYIQQKRCKSVLALPIINKGVSLGILYMENNLIPDAFTSERVALLQIIATQAAISIENARLFEQATTDGLTKLFVHRYFQMMLDQEIERCKRANRSFSILMMDIDDFKRVNDTYGHQLGDEVLRNVAQAIRKAVRVVDVAARYGGEEFAVILPETDAQGALVVAEKIRTILDQMPLSRGQTRLAVTLSMGVAAFPVHAGTKKGLIQSADDALYLSKRTGKNRASVGDKID